MDPDDTEDIVCVICLTALFVLLVTGNDLLLSLNQTPENTRTLMKRYETLMLMFPPDQPLKQTVPRVLLFILLFYIILYYVSRSPLAFQLFCIMCDVLLPVFKTNCKFYTLP